METEGTGYGLFVMEDVKKDELIIKYVGKIVFKELSSLYGMQYKGWKMWINANKKKLLSQARYMNHSCNPNCQNIQWGLKGIL